MHFVHSVVLVLRCKAGANFRMVEAIHADGRVFLSSTRLAGKLWPRCAVVSHRTHLDEIDLALQMIRETVDQITR